MKSTLKRLDAVHQRLATAVSVVDPKLLSKRPAEKEWSVAEVVQHLCLVEERVLNDLKQNLERPAVRVSFLKRLVPMRVVSLRFRRFNAPKVVRPSNPLPMDQMLRNYAELRASLKELCVQEGPHRLRQVCFKHPFLGNLDGVAAVSMVAFHEQRHLKQIREILKKVGRT